MYLRLLETLCTKKNTTQIQLAERLGYSNQSGLACRLKGKSIHVDTFVKIMNSLGYSVVVKPFTKSELL